MLLSMTGFGRCEEVFPDKHVIVDIRSLNSRHFDLNLRMPPSLRSHEATIRKMVTERCSRGKVDVNFNITKTGESQSVVINETIFGAYAANLKKLCQEQGLDESEILSAIMRLPSVVMHREELDDKEWAQLKGLLDKALTQFENYRAEEGKSMDLALGEYCNTIKELTVKVNERAPARLERIRERLDKGLDLVLNKKDIDSNRFEQEVVFYLEKLDIEEEVVRLNSHCDLFNQERSKKGVRNKGKKLAFIAQEMGREINTIGSKANDVDIQRVVVEMKDELEKIKEQINNIL